MSQMFPSITISWIHKTRSLSGCLFSGLLWGLIVLLGLSNSCTHSPHKSPTPSQRSQDVGPDHTSAEQQLLATVKHAEELGVGNPLLLSSLYSLANFYSDHHEYDKAANQLKRALQMKEQANGPNHPDVAAILKRYASLLQKANRPIEAANLTARAEAILAQFSPSHQPRE